MSRVADPASDETGLEVALTVDVDWAPDRVIEYTLERIAARGVSATVFATHDTPTLRGISPDFEVGLHPNFNPTLAGDGPPAARVLDALRTLYPDSRGVRSHSLVTSTRLVSLFAAAGLEYDSNLFLAGQHDLRPFMAHVPGFVRIPFGWEDDFVFMQQQTYDFVPPTAGLHVYAVHPVHVFLNTERAERYARARSDYHAPDALWAQRNKGPEPGTGDFLDTLLDWIVERRLPTRTLGALADDVRRISEADR